jgi:hypothetical protein
MTNKPNKPLKGIIRALFLKNVTMVYMLVVQVKKYITKFFYEPFVCLVEKSLVKVKMVFLWIFRGLYKSYENYERDLDKLWNLSLFQYFVVRIVEMILLYHMAIFIMFVFVDRDPMGFFMLIVYYVISSWNKYMDLLDVLYGKYEVLRETKLYKKIKRNIRRVYRRLKKFISSFF